MYRVYWTTSGAEYSRTFGTQAERDHFAAGLPERAHPQVQDDEQEAAA